MILADEELVKLSGYPVTPGIAARLMQMDQQTKERRGTACFMCKHCIPNPRKSFATCTLGGFFDPTDP